jgi:hypothetical protein
MALDSLRGGGVCDRGMVDLTLGGGVREGGGACGNRISEA